MTLAAYNFTILHRVGKTNPANAPSRRPDYANSAKPANRLLLTLQKKLSLLSLIVATLVATIRRKVDKASANSLLQRVLEIADDSLALRSEVAGEMTTGYDSLVRATKSE